jgi:hypothetical protein
MKRTLLAGLLGGLALFGWSFVAHLPPIGTAGERAVSPEQGDVVLNAMTSAMPDRAIYVLPGLEADQHTWLAKFERGPAAVVAYNPHPADQVLPGGPFVTWMLIEFVTALIDGLLGATLAARLAGTLGYWPRVFVVASVGLIATIDIDVSYWNWYAFPTSFLLAQFFDHVGGWFMAGLVMARMTGPAGTGRLARA